MFLSTVFMGPLMTRFTCQRPSPCFTCRVYLSVTPHQDLELALVLDPAPQGPPHSDSDQQINPQEVLVQVCVF